MEFADVLRSRRMTRRYDPDRPIPRARLDTLLGLAMRAPSAGFSQGRDLVVLTDPRDRELFWRSTSAPGPADAWLSGMRTAPVLVLCLSDPQRYLDRYAEPDKGWTDRDPGRWTTPFWDVDTGMAAFALHLAAIDAGLASCLFGVPAERVSDLRAALDIPADRRPVAVISIGHAVAEHRPPPVRRARRALSDMVHDGRFGVPWHRHGASEASGGSAHPAESVGGQ